MPCACRQPGPCSSATRGRVTCRAGSGSLPPRALMISEHSFKFLVGFMSSLLFKEDFLPLVCQKRENEQQLSCVRTTPVSHSGSPLAVTAGTQPPGKCAQDLA